jgi:hypothetical protein
MELDIEVPKLYSDSLIMEFGEEIQTLYELRQQEAGNKPNFHIVNVNLSADIGEGGFHWHETPEGADFWQFIFVNVLHGVETSAYYDRESIESIYIKAGVKKEESLDDIEAEIGLLYTNIKKNTKQ